MSESHKQDRDFKYFFGYGSRNAIFGVAQPRNQSGMLKVNISQYYNELKTASEAGEISLIGRYTAGFWGVGTALISSVIYLKRVKKS